MSQDAYEDAAETRVGFYPRPLAITTGFGSDVRFFDVPQLDAENSDNNDFIPLIGAGAIELIDDAGGRVFISVSGAEGLGVVGRVRVNAVNGSQGSMIGAIEVDDLQGFDLQGSDLQGSDIQGFDFVSPPTIIFPKPCKAGYSHA